MVPIAAAKAMVKFLKEGSLQWALCHVSSMEHQAATAPAFDVLVFRGTKTAEDKLVDDMLSLSASLHQSLTHRMCLYMQACWGPCRTVGQKFHRA